MELEIFPEWGTKSQVRFMKEKQQQPQQKLIQMPEIN